MNSIEQSSSWEANSHWATSQDISHLLQKSKVNYRAHKNPPLVPILSQMHPVHNFLHYFPKIHYNIIFQSTPVCPEWSLSFSFSGQNFVRISHLTMRTFQNKVQRRMCGPMKSNRIISRSTMKASWFILLMWNELCFWTLSIVWRLKKLRN
jgi:hypothetical protein